MDDETDLPLPGNHSKKPDDDKNPAADLIRKRVEEAYSAEPSAASETENIAKMPHGAKLSKHQKFIAELAKSGKSMAEIQVAWHEYYAGLTDTEKHTAWQEFYESQISTARHPAAARQHKPSAKPKNHKDSLQAVKHSFSELAERMFKPAAKTKKAKAKKKSPIHSLLFGLSAGVVVVVIVMFGFFNERFIAPLIQPSRSLSNVPLISSAAVGPDPEIIIPKINVEIPVVYGTKSINEDTVNASLEKGVVHYADTALPGQNGNVVIVGHSSNNIFNKGRYKFAFVLLSRMELGDTFYLQKGGKRYTYQIYQKKIVRPNDVSVLGAADKPASATLITCDPPGTSLNRLVVVGEQISPNPAGNKQSSAGNGLATQASSVPGNSPSLWSRIWEGLSR